MNPAMRFINTSVTQLCREKLSFDEEYRRLAKKSKLMWSAFRKHYPAQVSKKVLEMLDTDNLIKEIEADYLFFLGLQMGLELGGIDLLPKE